MRSTGTVVTGILLALMFGSVSNAVDSPETLRKIERRRRLQRIGAYERAKGLLDARKLQYADVLTTGAKGTAPGSMMDDMPRAASRFSTLDLDTLDSPGLAIGITSYDQQHNHSSGHQVARDPGASCVHFTWTHWRPQHTAFLNTDFIFGKNTDPEVQFLLGGENGLRGYSVRQFSGTKTLLFNLEDRRTIVQEWLNLVSLGWAVFADTGGADALLPQRSRGANRSLRPTTGCIPQAEVAPW